MDVLERDAVNDVGTLRLMKALLPRRAGRPRRAPPAAPRGDAVVQDGRCAGDCRVRAASTHSRPANIPSRGAEPLRAVTKAPELLDDATAQAGREDARAVGDGATVRALRTGGPCAARERDAAEEHKAERRHP